MPHLAIDFDGVIMRRSARDNLDQADFIRAGYRRQMPKRYDLKAPLIPGAGDALEVLARDWSLILHTCRARKSWGTDSVAAYLRKRGLLEHFQDITPIKPEAVGYIDDRAHHFTTWANVLETYGEGKE
jgi:hypothetical protein